MNLRSYLGRNLKDDEVIELLEDYELDVVYQFDRLHENTTDTYSASSKSAGFELRFNDQQILDTIWCYVKPRDGFSAVDIDLLGVPFYNSFSEALNTAEMSGIKLSRPPSGTDGWIRLEEERLWRHYEFTDSKLVLVTLMLPWE